MKIKMKNFSLWLGVFTLVAILITTGITAATAKQNSIAVYAYRNEPILEFDPSAEFDSGIIVNNNIYETLLRYDPVTDQVSPLLATGYTKSDDGLTWTFSIRKGVKFHDGTMLNAEAVKFSIERTKNLGQGASYIWSSVKAITVVDEYTVRFDLEYAAPLDLVASCGYAAFIMSPQAVQSHSEDWLSQGNEAGTGPYMLHKFNMGEEVILKSFKDYWKGWEGKHYDIVVIKKVSESSSRRLMVERGDAAITMGLPYEDIEELKNNSKIQVITDNSFINLILFLNTEIEPLNNKFVRQALSYAFPYQNVVKYAGGGYAKQGKGPIPEGIWGHGDDLFQYSFDLDKAKELLKQAGVPEGGFKIKLTYKSGDEAEKKMVEMYKAELSKLNIDLEIRGMPWESQWELAKSTKPEDRQGIYVMYWWPDVASPYSWLYNLYHSEKDIYFNLSYWKSPQFDDTIDQANELSANNRTKASDLFIKAQKLLIEEAVSIYAYDQQQVWVTNSSFKGFKNNPAYPNVVFFYDTYPE